MLFLKVFPVLKSNYYVEEVQPFIEMLLDTRIGIDADLKMQLCDSLY